jgi:hypothetical protein
MINWNNLEWFSIDDKLPEKNLFFPCWIMTDRGVILSTYDPDETFEPPEGLPSRIQGFRRGGLYFRFVTHWAYWKAAPAPGILICPDCKMNSRDMTNPHGYWLVCGCDNGRRHTRHTLVLIPDTGDEK